MDEDDDLMGVEEEIEENEEENVNDHECLWRDGDQAPEDDPEEWVDRMVNVEETTKTGIASEFLRSRRTRR